MFTAPSSGWFFKEKNWKYRWIKIERGGLYDISPNCLFILSTKKKKVAHHFPGAPFAIQYWGARDILLLKCPDRDILRQKCPDRDILQSKMSRSGHFRLEMGFITKMSRSGHFRPEMGFTAKMSDRDILL